MEGLVLVNQGETYMPAQSGMSLNLGARVLAMEDGSAVVTQADGCVTRLDPNSLFILKSPSVCQGGEAALQKIGPFYAQAAGETATDVGVGGSAGGAPTGGVLDTICGVPEDIGEVFGLTGTTACAVGAGALIVVAGGIGFGIYEATSDGEDGDPTPISPE